MVDRQADFVAGGQSESAGTWAQALFPYVGTLAEFDAAAAIASTLLGDTVTKAAAAQERSAAAARIKVLPPCSLHQREKETF